MRWEEANCCLRLRRRKNTRFPPTVQTSPRQGGGLSHAAGITRYTPRHERLRCVLPLPQHCTTPHLVTSSQRLTTAGTLNGRLLCWSDHVSKTPSSLAILSHPTALALHDKGEGLSYAKGIIRRPTTSDYARTSKDISRERPESHSGRVHRDDVAGSLPRPEDRGLTVDHHQDGLGCMQPDHGPCCSLLWLATARSKAELARIRRAQTRTRMANDRNHRQPETAKATTVSNTIADARHVLR